ncbi:MAG: tetratricopeptide repeat protein [Candidatus Delongbacteria bacterium]|jgi:tetratricopeptide (TPR) repeat protein|nr:tetratricopeptide repeat protein [Candidatus Delongbacteria bacterium]
MNFKKLVTIFLILLLNVNIFSNDFVEKLKGKIIVRTEGICYLDPGISMENAKIIAKYDAIKEALIQAGLYLEHHDSLLTLDMKKDKVMMYLGNTIPTTIYREGKEQIDGYPAYLVNLVMELNIEEIDRKFIEIAIDNRLRNHIAVDYDRMQDLFEKIDALKETTKKLPSGFIQKLTQSLTASEWFNKGYLTDEEGLKLEYYSIAIDLDELYISAYLSIGDVYIKLTRYAEALTIFNKLINLSALKFPAAYSKRGEIYMNMDDYNKASKEMEKAIALEPNYADAYNSLGILYTKLKQYDNALNFFQKAISIDENYYRPYYLRARLYRKSTKYDKALADYSKAIKLNPKNPDSYYNRGLIYYLTGKYDESIAEYSKAIYFKGDCANLYYNRGIAYRKTDMLKKAIADYKKYLKLTLSSELDQANIPELVLAWMDSDRFAPIFLD